MLKIARFISCRSPSCARIVGLVLLATLSGASCMQSSAAVATLTEEAAALEHQAQEHEVKAAMLYKFLGYTDWPATVFAAEDSPLRIWVLGSSSVNQELRRITAERTVNDRPVEIFTAKTVEHITDPHMVFVGRHAQKYLPFVAKLAKRHSMLIVTESDKGLEAGSTINLRLIDGRIGFDVSLADAQRHNLKLSARLLSVASSVDQGDH